MISIDRSPFTFWRIDVLSIPHPDTLCYYKLSFGSSNLLSPPNNSHCENVLIGMHFYYFSAASTWYLYVDDISLRQVQCTPLFIINVLSFLTAYMLFATKSATSLSNICVTATFIRRFSIQDTGFTTFTNIFKCEHNMWKKSLHSHTIWNCFHWLNSLDYYHATLGNWLSVLNSSDLVPVGQHYVFNEYAYLMYIRGWWGRVVSDRVKILSFA